MSIPTQNAVVDAVVSHLNNLVDVGRFHKAVNGMKPSELRSGVIVIGPSDNPTATALGKVLSQQLSIPYVVHRAETDIGTVDDLVHVHKNEPGIIITSNPRKFIYDVSDRLRSEVSMNVFDFSEDPACNARVYGEEELKADMGRYVGFCVHWSEIFDE